MSAFENEHAWFAEQAAAYVAGGLEGPERERFERHAAGCQQCAQLLNQLQQEDRSMQAIFAATVPGAAFEQRLIAGLRDRWTRRLVIHPLVKRAAAAVVAVAMLGGTGYVGSRWIATGGLPTLSSKNLFAMAEGDGGNLLRAVQGGQSGKSGVEPAADRAGDNAICQRASGNPPCCV